MKLERWSELDDGGRCSESLLLLAKFELEPRDAWMGGWVHHPWEGVHGV